MSPATLISTSRALCNYNTALVQQERENRAVLDILAHEIGEHVATLTAVRRTIAGDSRQLEAALFERLSMTSRLHAASDRHDGHRRFTGGQVTGWGMLL